MSRPVKVLLRKELTRRLSGVESLAVLSLAGVDGLADNRLRRKLRAKEISLTVVKNSIARGALEEIGLTAACGLIEGPCALAYGGEGVVSIVRELLDFGKDIPALRVKGALIEGELFGPDRVEQLSRYPTRREALSKVGASMLSSGGRLAGALAGPGGRVAGALKILRDRREEEQAAAAPVD